MTLRAGVVGGLLLGAAAPAFAQFGTPQSTPVRERISGNFVPGDEGPVPEQGDQIAASDKNGIAGVFEFDSGDLSFGIVIFGDDPATEGDKEGPEVGDKITFRFYDASTNETSDLRVLNAQGEGVNLTYQGQEIPDLPFDLPGLDLIPTRTFDLGPATGGGDGSGLDESVVDYDLNDDGRIDSKDAALVLRQVMRGGRQSAGEGATSVDADVNGDGSVTTADAIEVLRNRR